MISPLVSPSLANNARLCITRTERDLAEAKETPHCGPLVAALENQLEGERATYQAAVDASPALDEAQRVRDEALANLKAAQNRGSLDRAEHDKIVADREYWAGALRIRDAELAKAQKAVEKPLRSLADSRDPARERAEALSRVALAICESNFNAATDAAWESIQKWETAGAAERLWAPFFEARNLAAYEPKDRSRPKAALVDAYARTRAWRDARLVRGEQ